ncbi:MAG: DJ-1/PfpI family protein [Oscillospiraceae bacterium]
MDCRDLRRALDSGHKGLLNGRRAVCYPGFEEQRGAEVTGNPVETDGRTITANGPGAAVEFALELVARLVSRERAQKLRASL